MKKFIILSINSLVPLYTRVERINLINWWFFFFLPPSLFSFSLINITKEFNFIAIRHEHFIFFQSMLGEKFVTAQSQKVAMTVIISSWLERNIFFWKMLLHVQKLMRGSNFKWRILALALSNDTRASIKPSIINKRVTWWQNIS